jgi:hypothetical protein
MIPPDRGPPPDPNPSRPPKGQPPPPLTVEDIQRLIGVREGLQILFENLGLVLDVSITCRRALGEQNAEQDTSIANVLQRCGSDKLHEQLVELTSIVEDLGGKTEYSDDDVDIGAQMNYGEHTQDE